MLMFVVVVVAGVWAGNGFAGSAAGVVAVAAVIRKLIDALAVAGQWNVYHNWEYIYFNEERTKRTSVHSEG